MGSLGVKLRPTFDIELRETDARVELQQERSHMNRASNPARRSAEINPRDFANGSDRRTTSLIRRLTRPRCYESSHLHSSKHHGPTTQQVHQTQTPGRLPQAQESPREGRGQEEVTGPHLSAPF